jgi:hypothetical protein
VGFHRVEVEDGGLPIVVTVHGIMDRVVVTGVIVAVSAASPSKIEMEEYVAVIAVADECMASILRISGIVKRMLLI